MKAKLKRKIGPYRKGRIVTTDPEAPLIGEAARKKGPFRVDEARFKAWREKGFFEPEGEDQVKEEEVHVG